MPIKVTIRNYVHYPHSREELLWLVEFATQETVYRKKKMFLQPKFATTCTVGISTPRDRATLVSVERRRQNAPNYWEALFKGTLSG